MIKKILWSIVDFCRHSIINSCTKLEEEVLDESSVTGLTDKQIAEGNIAPVYAILPTYLSAYQLFCSAANFYRRGNFAVQGRNGLG